MKNVSSSAPCTCAGVDTSPGPSRTRFTPTPTEPAASPRKRQSPPAPRMCERRDSTSSQWTTLTRRSSHAPRSPPQPHVLARRPRAAPTPRPRGRAPAARPRPSPDARPRARASRSAPAGAAPRLSRPSLRLLVSCEGERSTNHHDHDVTLERDLCQDRRVFRTRAEQLPVELAQQCSAVAVLEDRHERAPHQVRRRRAELLCVGLVEECRRTHRRRPHAVAGAERGIERVPELLAAERIVLEERELPPV